MKQKAKDDFLQGKVGNLNIDGLNATALKDTCVKLYQKVWETLIYTVDFEYRLVKQDSDINELTVQVNDIKGKIHEASIEEGVQSWFSLYQDGGQERGAGFLRHRTQSHGEEGIQARGGEGKSGLPQRTEAWRRRVDQKKKTKKKNKLFLFFLSCCQTNFHHQCFSTLHYILFHLSFFGWLSKFVPMINILIFIDKISSFLFSLCDQQKVNKLAIPLVAMR